MLRIRAADLVRREPVCATASTTIRDAAATMAEHGVSALLIVDSDRLTGVVTDRDLRSRVLAVGLDPARPVSEVMTPDPITAAPDALAFEVVLAMVERTIHHVPLVADGRPVGVVTSTDLLRLEHANPVYLVGDVAKQDDVTGLAAVCRRLPGVVERLVGQDASADDIGRVVTAWETPSSVGSSHWRSGVSARRRCRTAGSRSAHAPGWSRPWPPTRTTPWSCTTTRPRRTARGSRTWPGWSPTGSRSAATGGAPATSWPSTTGGACRCGNGGGSSRPG